MPVLACPEPSFNLARLARPSLTALQRWVSPFSRPLELRIDVALPEGRVAADLARLNARPSLWQTQSEEQAGLRLPDPNLAIRVRSADGEYFVYVVDRRLERVVAYVTLSRLVEVNRHADRVLRAPHAKVDLAYRRRGIASTIYRWWLDSGSSLMTGARQSPSARALWLSMARRYRLHYVRLNDKDVVDAGDHPSPGVFDSLQCRAVLLGRGASLDALVAPAVARPATAAHAPMPLRRQL